MPVTDSTPVQPADSIIVQWSDVVRFVRQLSHDLRNHLNAVELQSAYLSELATDPEMKEEIKRLRTMVADSAGALQKLSGRLSSPAVNRISYRAGDFVEDLRTKLESEFEKEARGLEWRVDPPETSLEIDPQLLQQAWMELFANAFQHGRSDGPLCFSAGRQADRFVFALHEPKTKFELPTQNWGYEPLRHLNRGNYGLGLNRARAIVEAHGGKLGADYDSTESKLVTTMTLPLPSGTN